MGPLTGRGGAPGPPSPPGPGGPADHSGEYGVWFRVDDPSVARAARRSAMGLADRLGFTEGRAGEVGIAVTEAATNLLKYGRDGALLVRPVRAAGHAGVGLVALDHGPGIFDVAAAAVDGRSTGGTLGIGMGAIARLGSGLDIHSVPGRGTVLSVAFWPAGAAPQRAAVDGITRVMTGEQVCGDAWAVRSAGDRTVVLLCDGLGHGPLAARASAEAVQAFLADSAEAPAEVLRHLHPALAGTRGAAAAVACLDYGAGALRYAGVGNIAGSVVRAGRRTALLSTPGIVGHHVRAVRESSHPLGPDDILVMHSDGLTERWNLADYPGLVGHGPLVIAATLLRDAGLRRDDAAVLVGKRPPGAAAPRARREPGPQ